MVMAGGRPPIYKSVDEMSHLIDLYFIACRYNRTENESLIESMEEEDREIIKQIEELNPIVSGLAYWLGMTTETLRTYALQDEFSATIKRAKQRVEMSLEQSLSGTAVTGSIFSLKNNFKWKDKTEVEQNTSMTVVVEEPDAETL